MTGKLLFKKGLLGFLMIAGWLAVWPCAGAAVELPAATEADWAAIDVVPMPKHVRRMDTVLPLTGARAVVLVLGVDATVQDRIGADYINQRVKKLGGKPLAIVTPENAPAGAMAVNIGTIASQPAVAKAVKSGLVDVGDNNPGERGYEIRVPSDDIVYLAGVDPVGALYACITFAEMLENDSDGIVTWPKTEIRDWPDFAAVTLGAGHISSMAGNVTPERDMTGRYLQAYVRNPSSETRERYLAAFKDQVDMMLRWKISLVHLSRGANVLRWRNEFWTGPVEVRETFREGIEYARARGVGVLLYAFAPFVGLRAEHPDAPDDCTDARSARYGHWVRCWSLDDLRREYARDLARKVAEAGLTDFGFHDTDTGGYLNPAGWNERCERCRERWGNDYAAASANKARIFYEEFQKVAPDVRVHYTFYPYHCRTIDPQDCLNVMASRFGPGPQTEELAREMVEYYTDFWPRLNTLIPQENFTFVMREDAPEAVTRFRELTADRDVLWWEGGLWQNWAPFVSIVPTWWKTYYRPGNKDTLYVNYTGPVSGFFPVLPLLHREYSWNVNAPGAELWSRDQDGDARWRHGEPEGELFSVVLPHVVRNLFGSTIADDVTEALSRNVAPYQLLQGMRAPHHILRDPGTEMLDWQAKRAGEAAAAMDRAWRKLSASDDWLGLDDYELSRLAFLREAMYFAWYIGRIRAEENRARDLARSQDLAGAIAAITRGMDLCDSGIDTMAHLASQRPDHLQNFLRAPTSGRVRGFHNLMAENFTAESKYFRGILEATSKRLDVMAQLAGVPPAVMEKLEQARIVRALRVSKSPEVDGIPADQLWQNAHPVESFFLINEDEAHIASAHTRARLVYDEDNLYIGLDCKAQPDIALQPNDTVEIFLMPPELEGDYIQIFVRADGELRQQRLYRVEMDTETEVVQWERDTDWTGEGIIAQIRMHDRGWTAEVVIPFDALNARPERRWNINLCRASPDGSGLTELSAILPPGARSFHEPEKFPALYWTDEVFVPSIAVDIVGPTREVRTFSDAIATVISFGVRIESGLILNCPRLYAEAYDASGKLQGRTDIEVGDPLLYAWEGMDFEVRYDQEYARGGVRIVLEADEGTMETWYRFGGWEGAGGVGEILAPLPAGAGPGPNTEFALNGNCHVPGTVVAATGEQIPLLAEKRGTVEFWLRPDWRGAEYNPAVGADYEVGDHVLLHVGPPAGDDSSVNRRFRDAMMTIRHNAAGGTLGFNIRSYPMRAGWARTFKISREQVWLPGAWRHIACVWDADADPENWLRLYVDGVLSDRRTHTARPERLGDNPAVRYTPPVHYMIQIGSINDGTASAGGLISNLRISRSARYNENFAPPTGPFTPDKDTVLLLDFNGSLDGVSMNAAGELYKMTAVAGFWQGE